MKTLIVPDRDAPLPAPPAAETGDCVYFTDDPRLQQHLQTAAQTWLATPHLLSNEELQEVTALAAQRHADWLQSFPGSRHAGLPVATALVQFYEPWATALRKLAAYRRLLATVRPRRVIAPASEIPWLEALLASQPEVKLLTAAAPRGVLWQLRQRFRNSWLSNRVRYRGGWRPALHFYFDYWWSETPWLKARGRPASLAGDYVLFSAGYINHARTFLPILRRLPWPSLVIVSTPEACRYFRERGVPYRRFGHFITAGAWRHYRAWKAAPLRQGDLFGDEAIFHFAGVDLRPFLRASLLRLLRQQLGRLRLYAEVYLDLLERARPRHVVVADDTTTHGRIIVLAAQALGIPTLNIQHGAIADVQHYRQAVTDKLAVWGEHDRALLMRHGVAAEKIVVTGQPRFAATAIAPAEAAGLRRRYRLPAGVKVLLWATTPFVPRLSYDVPERNSRYLRALLEILAAEPQWFLLIKLHPRDQREAYEKGLSGNNRGLRHRVRLLQNEDMQELLPLADVLLAWNTSVIQEAVLAGKAIIGINFFGMPEAIPSVSEGVAVPARDAAELQAALQRILAGDQTTLAALAAARPRYAARYLNAGERSAVDRILELLAGT
ncbi:MAG: UDP-N-acetylglucosamine 2-epimerase [candidate division KSB1 bacterium]|nr:UDP-N-acetylglucosamine 2-epimerase [candidate division KSB1 bacterium]MDZ7274898.1 UDP-N-acetylglucosamine 2-epimerase [candidate division KSB1 bacterium]MDZ7286650.1 UDP-N-acetylglucosamine 2-epimerase [candidate division KSB1 bacterium]MDZ7299187.1 UDP-N-acetylglucosamine 2-epimerase [candidate division KSB1 bacterium]MDZ7308505.1 UDP-N-acetylglucosamine 2-epimerase [candidate division KSB1 bacterium]